MTENSHSEIGKKHVPPLIADQVVSATEIPQADPAAFKPEKGAIGILDLIEQTGRIFSVPAPGTARRLILAGQEYVAPVCDDAHYDKLVTGPLSLLRQNHRDGLFTGHTDEPDWQKAHAILMPAFSLAAIHSYLPLIFDPASQLVTKWARTNFGEDIDLVADTTRLTFETIGLVGFGYRFGSFYREGRHPFIDSMVTVLTDAMMRGFNPATDLSQPLPEPVVSACEYLDSFVAEVIAQRRNYPDLNRSNDLLDRMLHGVDPATGIGLDDRNITNQIITILIAGHETTSGLLSFTIYELLNNSEVLDRCYAEVDAVLGDDLDSCPSAAQVSKLRYVMQVLKETLRLWPTAPGFVRHAKADTTLLDRYNIRSDDPLTVLRRPGLPFWPPADPDTPMIMVATGTGIAPFRGFLQDRAVAAANQPVAPSMLFFGCRNSGSDFLLADELKGYAQTGIAGLFTAFSDEPGQPPTRVQDRIREHASQVWESLAQGATVYVCGHAGRVAPAVREALAQVHQDSTGSDLAVATAWVEELRSTHRLLEDVWASA